MGWQVGVAAAMHAMHPSRALRPSSKTVRNQHFPQYCCLPCAVPQVAKWAAATPWVRWTAFWSLGRDK